MLRSGLEDLGMKRILQRWGWLPVLVLTLGIAVWLTAFLEQERQYDALRRLYENQARVLGRLVRESAQQATRSTALIHQVFLDKAQHTLERIGVPGPEEDCAAVSRDAPDVVLWIAKAAGELRGCATSVDSREIAAILQRMEALPGTEQAVETTLGDQEVLCLRNDRVASGTIACVDRHEMREMQREAGIGPLLSGLEGPDLVYVVVQDDQGILAATPGVQRISSVREDPFLTRALSGPGEGLQGRTVVQDGRTMFEVVAPIEMADGTTAVVRAALDAQGLVLVGQANRRRLVLLGSLLAGMVVLSGLLAWVLDRNARHREEYAREIRRRDQEMRRWQEIGEMAATVAHEVRNPLNTILLVLQRLEREVHVSPADEPDFREWLALAKEASGRVERVVGDFLELGRPLAIHPEVHRLDDLLREIADGLSMRAMAESKHLRVLCPEGLEVRVDRPRFVQALGNLALNALQAVNPGGDVTLIGERTNQGVRVLVRDDGPGMDPETLVRVQRPFVTTRPSGTGLGIPLARRLIEAHGGTLEFESAPGAGTTAIVRLASGTGTAILDRDEGEDGTPPQGPDTGRRG